MHFSFNSMVVFVFRLDFPNDETIAYYDYDFQVN